MMNMPNKAVVLLSGGLDSATVLAIAKSQGYELYALSFSYGQRHIVELEAARRVAASIGVAAHRIAAIDLPKGRTAGEMAHGNPITYVPARNTIFLSFALAWAEVLGSSDIFIGVNALDYSGYPDCRPEFIQAFERMANLATKAGVEGRGPHGQVFVRGVERRQMLRIHTPLIALTKAEIVRKGRELGVDYSLTSSCYDPSPAGEPCGECDSCLLRRKGFRENGIEDPLTYSGRSG